MVDYPLGALEPAIEFTDPEFLTCIDPQSPVYRIWSGGIWTEGPAWLPGAGLVVWSDIPNDRILFWRLSDGETGSYRTPSNGANGNTTDRQGRLITCEQYTRRIVRTEVDGTIAVVAEKIDGQRFTAPNDVVVKSDGTVWFTDPDYGRGSPKYQGMVEVNGCHVYCCDPRSGRVQAMTSDMVMPNGLAFSPDESVLYVIDTGSTHLTNGPNHIRAFRVSPDRSLEDIGIIAEDPDRLFDGLRVDEVGRLWCGVGEGVRCYSPSGTLLGRIRLPERASNLEFVGPGRTRLAVCGTTSLYSVETLVRPARELITEARGKLLRRQAAP